MTDEQFLETLDEDKRFWWTKMIKKEGSVEAVRLKMSGYVTRRQNNNGGFTNPDTLKKAIETRNKNRG